MTDWRAARDRIREDIKRRRPDGRGQPPGSWDVVLDAIALADELDRRDAARRLCPYSDAHPKGCKCRGFPLPEGAPASMVAAT